MKKKIDNLAFLVIMILIFVQFLCTTTIGNIVRNNFTYIYMFIIALAMYQLIISKKKKIGLKDCLFIIYIIVHVVFSYFFNNSTGWGWTDIIGTIILINLFEFVQFDVSKKNILLYMSIAIGIYMSILSKSITFAFFHKLGSFNPNLIGQVLLLCLIIVHSFLDKKILKIIITLIYIFGIYNCESRTSLIFALLFLILVYSPLKNKFKNKKFVKFALICIFMCVIAIPFVYTYMFNNNIEMVMSFSNKSFFSGRQRIWIGLIDKLKYFKNLYWGMGTNNIVFIRTGLFNAHNIFFASLVNIGLIPSILFFIYLFKNIININFEQLNKQKILYLIAIIIILATGGFETMLFYAPFSIIISLIISNLKMSIV